MLRWLDLNPQHNGVYRRFSLGLGCAAGLGCPALVVGLVERECARLQTSFSSI